MVPRGCTCIRPPPACRSSQAPMLPPQIADLEQQYYQAEHSQAGNVLKVSAAPPHTPASSQGQAAARLIPPAAGRGGAQPSPGDKTPLTFSAELAAGVRGLPVVQGSAAQALQGHAGG
jgi:hypothetical protein